MELPRPKMAPTTASNKIAAAADAASHHFGLAVSERRPGMLFPRVQSPVSSDGTESTGAMKR